MDEELENNEAGKKKGSSLVIIIVILLFVLLLSIMGVIAWLIASSSSDESVVINPAREESLDRPRATPTQRGTDFSNIGPMYPLDPFTLNLLSDSGSRYLKCTIELEQNTEFLKAELDKKVAVVRDIIIRTLTSKTFEEVSTQRGKERLKDELVGRLNEILTDGFIKNIYFTDFVVS